MGKKGKVTTVLGQSASRSAAKPTPPNTLTTAERRKLSKLEYADTKLLLEQIGYRHQVFNAIDVEIALPELPEEEIVQRFLHLANARPTPEQKVFAMLYCADQKPLSHGHMSRSDIAWAQEEGPRIAADLWWESVAEIRKKFRKAVLAAMRNTDAARRRYSKKIRDSLEQIVTVPRPVWDGSSGRIEHRLFAPDPSVGCGYALMLLLDEQRPLGALLRQCKFEECQRPFLGFHAASGSPTTVYCSDECTKFAKRYQNAARQAALRERRKKGGNRPKGKKT